MKPIEAMTKDTAQQIADLINSRNDLAKQYSARMILDEAKDYLWDVRADCVIGAVRVQRVQWYQAEISHLSVHPDNGQSGIGSALLSRAMQQATASGARIAQCTIRDSNKPSIMFFTKHRFIPTIEFFYPPTGNTVRVFQRLITTS